MGVRRIQHIQITLRHHSLICGDKKEGEIYTGVLQSETITAKHREETPLERELSNSGSYSQTLVS